MAVTPGTALHAGARGVRASLGLQEAGFYRPENPVRLVTAAALFDGHDASINIVRRLLQAGGAEVVHLGHNRSVADVVTTALQEDVQGIAVSSYQGGHMEFFKYMKDLLARSQASQVRVFAGGGGTILPREIQELEASGIEKVFSPEDGRRLGLVGMTNIMLKACDFSPLSLGQPSPDLLLGASKGEPKFLQMARFITLAERPNWVKPEAFEALFTPLREAAARNPAPVVGLTGPGGAGKSSFTDELLRRFKRDQPKLRVAVLSVDPTKRATGGALLGDRIRMNSVYESGVYMRSLATRSIGAELSKAMRDAIVVVKAAGVDLVLLETSGIGQASSSVVDLAALSIYVMTPEYGASSQLEKIDMLDLADMVVVNKFDRRGAADALRDVRKQFRRARQLFDSSLQDADLPCFGTTAAEFNDRGVNAAYACLVRLLNDRVKSSFVRSCAGHEEQEGREPVRLIPPARQNHLAEVAAAVRQHRKFTEEQVERVRELRAVERSVQLLEERGQKIPESLSALLAEARRSVDPKVFALLAEWRTLRDRYREEELVFSVRQKELREPLRTQTLAGLSIPRVALPPAGEDGALVRFLLLENLPGHWPFTAGVYPLRRRDEDPKRMFAGEGSPERTNQRFHLLCEGEPSARLSTAFDSVTLYGQDPDRRPDIYGKVGESGVSVCTLDDMKKLYAGFDLCDLNTSVSMTINGPAPIMLAFFLNTAIDQQVDKFREQKGRLPSPAEHSALMERVLKKVRGTVQADILKEDQAQNTCIFSIGFALKMMGDIQEYFIQHEVRNYYSVSISGYHIAEAGANPISQLAFTLANGFTYVEYYLSRGMAIDDFAPNLSFFFSNGLDAEYTVLGRVARRIWAIAMDAIYKADTRSQKLKYHIQTSGRSLHAMEISFNDIRTTLQALLAFQDSCNSLHTNAYDEAVTTPTAESVRRAMAIQLIISREFGLARNENPLQGSYIVELLTDMVEEAVLREFEKLADRGGVLGAMETQYQRSRIQEESLLYERLKHSGELPIVGVNTFVDSGQDSLAMMDSLDLSRSSPAEKEQRLEDLLGFQERHLEQTGPALASLRRVALEGGNIFSELMHTSRVASLGQITHVLFEVGGKYRRNL